MPLPSVEGALFKYGPKQAHCAFRIGSSSKHFVTVGGLTNGFLFTSYWEPLAAALQAEGWSVVQPLLSSSFQGWGTSSLDTDADEIHTLAQHLRTQLGSQGFVLFGHSTGTQDAVRYTQRHRSSAETAPLQGVILQAPVSDREALALEPDTAQRLETAQEMVADGRGEDILLRDWGTDGTPICARRYVALAARGGDDDMFSSDLTDEEMQEIIGALDGLPTLVLMSGADQYVPDSVDKQVLTHRIAAAAGAKTSSAVIAGAKHEMEGHEGELVQSVLQFLSDSVQTE